MPTFLFLAKLAAGPAPRTRRLALAAARATTVALVLMAAGAVQAFGLDEVAERARSLAGAPFVAAPRTLPDDLKDLNYDQYRDIRFSSQRALWHSEALPFELMFFHLGGSFHNESVVINEIEAGKARHLAFDRHDFDYGKNTLKPDGWGDLGYAGLRVHYALNTPAYKDELAVFLGASYFRALGQGQLYGLSARGLAVDTPGPGPEEFPRFIEFWFERPAPQAASLVMYALLDSRRVAGAYRFTIAPGDDTTMTVQARPFLREGAQAGGAEAIKTLGLAPLTSMFYHGANQTRPDDFRPEVHDSDGLMVATADGPAGGEWLWRPLLNPSRLLVTSFAVQNLRGFGLMQRQRDFNNYQDTEAHYERRPSAWVTPEGNWGPGRVELMQLPTPDETNDNIVAYWVPEQLPAPGTPLEFSYQLHWQGDRQQHPPTGWTTQTRRGHGYVNGAPNPREVQYVVDFDGPELRALDANAAVEAVASCSANATIIERNSYRNTATGGWRMTLRIARAASPDPVELRAFLQSHDHPLTETWTTILPTD